jgi:hypothetical protein
LKQLYFLHIPKTAGMYVSKNIKRSLEDSGKKSYISTYFPNNNFFQNKTYISMHAGTYPIDVVPGIDVATIIRDPISARASYFNFIYNKSLHSRNEYKDIKYVEDKFKYYLFEDKNFEIHNNYQSRFICNSADSRSFDPVSFYKNDWQEMMKPFLKEGKAFTWFVENNNTSLDNAVNNINNFSIVNTLDRIDIFENKVSEWFKSNHGIEIVFNKDEVVNKSEADYGYGQTVTTPDLIKTLSAEEKEKVLKNNYIDSYIYNYVKEIESKTL